MYTLRGIENRIKDIMERVDFDESTVKALDEIYQERKEIDGYLRSRAKDYDEEKEEFNEWNEESDWESRYNDLKAKYMGRFFHGETSRVTNTDLSPEQQYREVDIKDSMIEEEEDKQIDDLFKEE